MNHAKIVPADLDSPPYLRAFCTWSQIVVVLLFFLGVIFFVRLQGEHSRCMFSCLYKRYGS